MNLRPAAPADLDPALRCLVAAFAQDPITGFLLGSGPGYPDRLRQFFALLMRARLALGMPVLVAHEGEQVLGAAMGYSTRRPAWPGDVAEDWDRFEQATPGMSARMAAYDAVAEGAMPTTPHYYLGVIGTDPDRQGQGLGSQLLQAFCALSAADPRSTGVYLETATASNLPFYERAGFARTGHGPLGAATLWCLYRAHGPG